MERATFLPAVTSVCGGMRKAASTLFKRMAALIAEKEGERYQSVMTFIRCKDLSLFSAHALCVSVDPAGFLILPLQLWHLLV